MEEAREKIMRDRQKPKELRYISGMDCICTLIAFICYFYPEYVNQFAKLRSQMSPRLWKIKIVRICQKIINDLDPEEKVVKKMLSAHYNRLGLNSRNKVPGLLFCELLEIYGPKILIYEENEPKLTPEGVLAFVPTLENITHMRYVPVESGFSELDKFDSEMINTPGVQHNLAYYAKKYSSLRLGMESSRPRRQKKETKPNDGFQQVVSKKRPSRKTRRKLQAEQKKQDKILDYYQTKLKDKPQQGDNYGYESYDDYSDDYSDQNSHDSYEESYSQVYKKKKT